MSRPAKTGLDYYPMDVGFLRDKKVRLLRAEFGASSVVFVLYVLSKVYEEDGYYLKWDKDECLIAADELRESPAYIGEVLQGCLTRSLFDERVFQMFGVLTSAGVQRRYLRGCEKRDVIEIIQEYWLLNVDNKNDVPAGIRNKLAFLDISGGKNSINSPGNSVKSPGNPQSKVKKSKVEESKESTPSGLSPAATPANEKPVEHKYGEYGWVLLTDEQYARLLAELGEAELQRCITYIDESAQSTGNKNRWRDWNLVLRKCSKEDWGKNGAVKKSAAEPSFDKAVDYSRYF